MLEAVRAATVAIREYLGAEQAAEPRMLLKPIAGKDRDALAFAD
ncbi:hypothetical protein ACSMX9_09215 [Streptomyces sp. LE64]